MRLLNKIVCLAALGSLALAGACQTDSGQRGLMKVLKDANWAYERGNYETAAADYREYLERRPGDPIVAHRLARSYLEIGQPSPAVDVAWQAFDRDPNNTEYLSTVAEALYEAGRTEELYRFLRTQTADRGHVEDYLRLGYYAAKLGHPDEAEQALLTGARLDAGRTVGPQLALADFYASIGDQPSALQRLRMALYVDPANPEVLAKLRALGEIPGPSLAIRPEEAR